jgi:hypothetical protein
VTLPELLSVVKDAYESIEVRTVAADIGGTIYNVVTLVQFSTSAQDACNQNMKSRLAEHSPLVEGPLQIRQMCSPIDRWPELSEEFKAGELKFPDLAVSLGNGADPDSFSASISAMSGYIQNPTEFPMFQVTRAALTDGTTTEPGRTLGYIAYRPDVMKQLSRSGINGFRAFARDYLGASDTDPGGPSLIAIVAPVPMMVTRIEIDAVGQRIRAFITRHPKLSNGLQLRAEVLTDQLWGGRHKENLSFGKLSPSTENEAHANAELGSTSLNDAVHLLLVHDDLGIVHDQRFQVRRAVPAIYVNPMFETLKRFCSADEFKSMVTEPRTPPRDKGKDESKLQRQFEQHMQWFLSCFGFAAVQLGVKEYLYEVEGEEGSKRRLGSLDLLAFHREKALLLLGSCTLNPPKEDDFANLITLKAALAEGLRRDAGIDVALAIFTNADRCLPSARYEGNNFVAVFDKPRTSQLMDSLSSGEEDSFFESLTDKSGQMIS